MTMSSKNVIVGDKKDQKMTLEVLKKAKNEISENNYFFFTL